jgi:hypothetical protein
MNQYVEPDVETQQSPLAEGSVWPPFDLREAVKHMIIRRATIARRFVLLIGGPGCAGKSTFAEELRVPERPRSSCAAPSI